MKKSFAQLKRDLQVGVKVKTLFNACKPENNGEVREVGKVQTNAIAFTKTDGNLSWLWWDSKHYSVNYENDIFTISLKSNGEKQHEYQIVNGK